MMADREMIRQTLIELMEADIGEKFTDLQDSKRLREELGLDSVDVVSIVSQIERHFRVRLSQQELEKLVSIGDLLNLLVAKLVPADEPEEQDLRRVVGEIREIRKGATLNGVSLRELINEGRRY